MRKKCSFSSCAYTLVPGLCTEQAFFCLFIIWVLCLLVTEVLNSLLTWDMYTFIRYMLSKYFLLICDLPLQFLSCIFQRAIILNLMKIIYQFFLLGFIFCVSCFKTICLTGYYEDFLLFCFFRNLIVLALVFRNIMHFRLTFVCIINWKLMLLFFSHTDIQLFHHHFLKRKNLTFSHWITLSTLSIINWPCKCGPTSALLCFIVIIYLPIWKSLCETDYFSLKIFNRTHQKKLLESGFFFVKKLFLKKYIRNLSS